MNKYSMRVSRPLAEEADQAMVLPIPHDDFQEDDFQEQLDRIMPGLLEKISAESASMDELIIEIVGVAPVDSGAGLGQRDLIWYDVQWDFATAAAKKLLDLGGDIHVCLAAMPPEEEQKEND